MRDSANVLKVPLLASLRPCAADQTLITRSICANRKSTSARAFTTSALKREFELPTLTSQGMPAATPVFDCRKFNILLCYTIFPAREG